ncbi:MAG: copper resistance protein B, partial [Alphaproteobacteria bacterium]
MKKFVLMFAALLATPVWAAEPIITKLSLNQLERLIGDEHALAWDATFWAGRDRDKIQIEASGENALGGNGQSAEVSVLYRRAVSPFFDMKVGLRHEAEPDDPLTHLALGFEGLAVQWWDVEGMAYFSEEGDATASFAAATDLRLTQKLILQPDIEVGFSTHKVASRGHGAGLTEADIALRLRYQATRNIAPYIGWAYTRRFGGT